MTIRLCVCVDLSYWTFAQQANPNPAYVCVCACVCMCEDQWQPLEQGMAEMELSAVMEDRK